MTEKENSMKSLGCKKRGRPRKNPAARTALENQEMLNEFYKLQAAQNPDEAVATKGYVKCVARALNDHCHKKDNDPPFALIAASISGASLFLVLLDSIALNHRGLFPEWAYWALVVFFLVECISAADQCYEGGAYTFITHETPKITNALERWEPPEPKKEC